MPDEHEIPAVIAFSEKGGKETKKAIDEVDARLKKLKVDRLNKEFAQTQKALAKIRGELRNLKGDELAKAEVNAAKLEERAAGIVKQVARINTEASQIPNAFGEASKRFAVAGDIESQFRTITGAVGFVGGAAGGQIEQIANIAAELFAVAEAAPRLSAALGDVRQRITPVVSGAVDYATAIGDSLPVVSGAKAGFVAMGVAIGGVAIATAAIGLAIQEWNKHLEQLREGIRQTISVIGTRNEAEAEARNLIEAGNKAAIEARVKELKGRLEIEQANADDIVALRDTLQSKLDEINPDALEYVLEGVLIAPSQREQFAAGLRAQIDELNKQIESADKGALRELNTQLAVFEDALGKVKDTAETIDPTALKAIATERATVLEAINRLEDQALQQRRENIERQSQIAIDREIRDTRTLEDYSLQREAALEQHQSRLAAIETQGQARLESIRAEMDSLPGDLADSLAKADSKASDAIAKVNRDFMRSEVDAVAKFRDDERKRTRNYNKQRLRDIEDLHDSLQDAEQANDVIQFLRVQREGEKRLQRSQEDFDTEAQDRQQAYLQERDAARQARQERIADIQAQAETEKTELRKNAEARRLELLKALEAEQAAIQERTAAEIAGYEKSEEAAQKAFERRATRQKQDDDLQDQRQKQAQQRALQLIDQKKNAEIAALNAIIAKARTLGSASFSSSSSSSSSSQTRSFLESLGIKTGGGSGTSGSQAIVFGNEGYVTQPTFSVLGDNLKAGYAEAAVQFKMSEGLPASVLKRSGGAGGIVVNAPLNINNPTFGDIASSTEVTQALQATIDELTFSIQRAVMQARFNPKVS